jgi:hypothetical protein
VRLDRMLEHVVNPDEFATWFPLPAVAANEPTFAPVAARRNLRLHIRRTRLHVRSDRVLVRRLLQNLVSNALKYTPTGGHVAVTASVDQGRFVVDVADGLTFEPGFYGFIGKRGRYFSPLAEGGPQGGNDNRAVLRMRFGF